VSGPAAARAGAHAFVDDLDDPVLSPGDRHHLDRVLRLHTGALISIADGRGRWRLARFGPSLSPDGPVETEPAPRPELAVAFALVKGDRPEWVVQKLTELGVDRIVPMHTERCVVRWDGARADRHLERLRTVVREAAMQSRRAWLPTVEPVQPFAAVATRPGAALARADGEPPCLARPLLLVGPEGGWSSAEEAAVTAAVRLGDQVLRAETAAVTAGALLAALRSGLVREPRPPLTLSG
jgi:16S rRNA (uracil1498-N3)-methyltransferase